MSRYKFPASIPRNMYWSSEAGGTSVCPACGSRLEAEAHTYSMAICRGGEIEPFLAGCDGGHFCPRCETVVLDHGDFEQLAAAAMGTSRNVRFKVLGLVDLEAVPRDKKHLAFDESNPVPVTEFSNLGLKQRDGPPQSPRPRA